LNLVEHSFRLLLPAIEGTFGTLFEFRTAFNFLSCALVIADCEVISRSRGAAYGLAPVRGYRRYDSDTGVGGHHNTNFFLCKRTETSENMQQRLQQVVRTIKKRSVLPSNAQDI